MSVRLIPASAPVALAVNGDGCVDDALAALGLRPAHGWPHPDTGMGLRALAAHGEATATFLIVHGDDVVGECGWRCAPDNEGEVELSYGLSRAYRGQGVGTAAVEALCQWTAAQPGVRSVVAQSHVDNHASRRLLLRLGFAGPDPTGDPLQVRYVRKA